MQNGTKNGMKKFSLQLVGLSVFALGLIWFSGEGSALQRPLDDSPLFAAETLRIDMGEVKAVDSTTAKQDGSRKHYQQIKKLTNAIVDIRSRYMDTIDTEALVNAGIRGMLQDLDRYSVLMERENYDNLMESTSGKYEGVGMQIDSRDDFVQIISPIEGGPAEKLGLRAGDVILEIEGKSTHKMKTSDASSLMRGKAGTAVKVKIRREGVADDLDFEIERAVIALNSVNYAGRLPSADGVPSNIGYIRLSRFAATSVDELRKGLSDMDASNLDGLIFDIRSNGGGLLDQAVAISELFVKRNSMVVYTQGKDATSRRTYRSRVDPIFPDKPMIVLVDEGTASASEIVAGAMQDLDRALVLGQTTYGKGLVQQVINFEDDPDVYLKLTTARYYTPSGRCIQRADRQAKSAGDEFADESANPDSVKDTLSLTQRDVHHTATGRVVYGGGGIVPDVPMEVEYYKPLIINLMRKSLFFDFASKYLAKHGEVSAQSEVSNATIEEFRKFIKEKKFEYKTSLQVALDDFKKAVETDDNKATYQKKITEFEALISSEKEEDFTISTEDIRQGIKREFVSHLGGERGRYEEVILKTDKTITKAAEILRNAKEYNRLLTEGASADHAQKM